jgi:hypothetical protein
MTEEFDPRLVQSEYLLQAGFREQLLAALQDFLKISYKQYEFSSQNETRRVNASIWLTAVLGDWYQDTDGLTSHTAVILAANRVLEHYDLGPPIYDTEIEEGLYTEK